MDEKSLNRNALYYPYIHVRDPNWLKATLLCFGRLHRMVPQGFHPRDAEEILPFLYLTDADNRSLLCQEYLEQSDTDTPVSQAQQRLQRVIEANLSDLQRRYSQTAAREKQLKVHPSEMIHGEKIRGELFEFLRSKGLAWHPEKAPYGEPSYQWLEMFPPISDAIMSTIAITVARQKGLDIVTHNGRTHHAIATLNENEVFSALANLPGGLVTQSSPQEKADELAQVILTSTFDLSLLTPEQVSELLKEGASLHALKDALIPLAQRLPDIEDPEERMRRLEETADEVREEWKKFQSVLVRLGAAAMVEAQDTKPPEWGTALIGGATSIAHLYLGFGLVLAVVGFKGANIYRKFRLDSANPYAFLSKVQRAVDTAAQGQVYKELTRIELPAYTNVVPPV